MSENWLRYFKMTIQSASGFWDLSTFRVKFHIKNVTHQTPGSLEARIYNLSLETRNRIREQRYVRVTLEAGYVQNHGILFDGWARQIRHGHETPTETFLDVLAQIGDKALNVSSTNKTFPPNSTHKDLYDHAVKDMQKADPTIKKGYVGPDLSKIKYPRAYTHYGMTRNLVRMIAESNKATWHISGNGEIILLKNDRSDGLPGGAIKVSSKTGMIGSPVQTYEGVLVRHFINPEFRVGKFIQIDQSSIVQEAPFDLSYSGGGPEVGAGKVPQLSPDGTYRILAIDWNGDTRATPWYAELYTYYKTIPAGGTRFPSPPGGP